MAGLFFKRVPECITEKHLQKLVSELDIGKITDIIIQKNKSLPDYHAIIRLDHWNYKGPNKNLIERLHRKSNISAPIYYTDPIFIYYNQPPCVLLSMYKLPETNTLISN